MHQLDNDDHTKDITIRPSNYSIRSASTTTNHASTNELIIIAACSTRTANLYDDASTKFIYAFNDTVKQRE